MGASSRFEFFGSVLLACGLGGCDAAEPAPEDLGPAVFVRVTISNVSAPGAFQTSKGPRDILLSPGLWSVHDIDNPLLAPGAAAGPGLESLAEDGDPARLFADLRASEQEGSVGMFGSRRPGENYADNPLAPGEQVEFMVWAEADQALSFAAMFVLSNDVVVGLGDTDGLLIHDLEIGVPRDVSADARLWDVGTEVNEEPGIGDSQPGQQSALGDGQPEGGTIVAIEGGDRNDFGYPAVASFLQVTLERLE